MDFKNLEFVKEYPTIIAGKYPLRLYRSREGVKANYRYHFGFPEGMVKPICTILECTPFWGEEHWKEVDGFWLWWLTIMSETEDIPSVELNRDLAWRISSINNVNRFYRKTLAAKE